MFPWLPYLYSQIFQSSFVLLRFVLNDHNIEPQRSFEGFNVALTVSNIEKKISPKVVTIVLFENTPLQSVACDKFPK